MDEKKMTLKELIGWLNDNDVSYGIDDAGKLTVKGGLRGDFRDWVEACRYTGLPEELVRANGDLWLEQTSIMSLGGLTSVGGSLDLQKTSIISLGNLTSVGGDLDLKGTSITSLGNLTSVGWDLILQGASIPSLDDLPQVGGDLHLDQSQLQLLTREALRKVEGNILYWGLAGNRWVTLSPAELEAVIAENEQRERLHNTRGSDVDWDLYDR